MAGILLFIMVYKFWSVALSYLSTWAAQASKQNSNFEVKRNRLVSQYKFFFFKKSVDPKWENGGKYDRSEFNSSHPSLESPLMV